MSYSENAKSLCETDGVDRHKTKPELMFDALVALHFAVVALCDFNGQISGSTSCANEKNIKKRDLPSLDVILAEYPSALQDEAEMIHSVISEMREKLF